MFFFFVSFFSATSIWPNDDSDNLTNSCPAEDEIVIAENLTDIEPSKYENCISLYSVSFEHSDKIIEIPSRAFYGTTNLSFVILPPKLKKISKSSFESSSISTITFPETLEEVEDFAFYNCSKLNSIKFPSSITSFGSYVFAFSSIHSFEYFGSVDISDGMFLNCSSLSTARIKLSNLTSIGKEAFKNTPVSDIHFPDSLIEIKEEAFSHCLSFKIELPHRLHSIGDKAFEYSGYQTLALPNGTSSLGSEVFQFCFNLTFVHLQSSINVIPHRCFFNCTSLQKVYIDSYQIRIEDGAFEGCNQLSEFWMLRCQQNLSINDAQCKNVDPDATPSPLPTQTVDSYFNFQFDDKAIIICVALLVFFLLFLVFVFLFSYYSMVVVVGNIKSAKPNF